MKRAILDELLSARRVKKPVALVTALELGNQAIVYTDTAASIPAFSADIVQSAQRALDEGRSTSIETKYGTVFIHVFLPPRRLLIVGAVHIAQALAPMAALADYEVTVIDPRRAFATDTRFPAVNVLKEWPDRALERLAPDARTAIVTLTHDPKLDEAALKAAFASDAFYIGALGSKKTQAARRERLANSGVGEQALSRIHGPAGLHLGAKTPGEIAISIMAEVTQVLHQQHATTSKQAR